MLVAMLKTIKPLPDTDGPLFPEPTQPASGYLVESLTPTSSTAPDYFETMSPADEASIVKDVNSDVPSSNKIENGSLVISGHQLKVSVRKYAGYFFSQTALVNQPKLVLDYCYYYKRIK